MYNGIGLTTPRGSGTNGHIQSNKFFVRPKSNTAKDAGNHGSGEGLARKPNRDILEHDRKRQMELKLVVLEDKLADQGYTDSEIAEKISEARKNLEAAAALDASREAGEIAPLSVSDNKVSDTQTHQVAARKEKQMETLRAALGIVPDAPLKKDEPKSNSEDGSDDDKISDGSDKGLDDDVKLHKKDPKKRNGDSIKAVKDQKNESGGDGNHLRSHKNQQNKELGELTDSSDTEADEKNLRRIPKKHQKYQGSASESDSDKKSKNPSRVNRKGRRHDNDYSDSDDEKHVKETRKVHEKRSRRHEIDEVDFDDEKHVEETRKVHEKRSRRQENDEVDSDDENRESSERHEKRGRKHDENVKSANEKYGERHDKRSRRHGRDDSLSDHEHYERDDKKSRRHDNGAFGSRDELEKTSKRSDKEIKGRDSDGLKYYEVKDGELREVGKVSSTDRWNNKHDKDNKKYDAGNNFGAEKNQKLKKSNESTSRNGRHDSDDDKKNIEKTRKSRKNDSDVDDSSSDGTVGSDSDSDDYRRRKGDKEKNKQGRNSSTVIERKYARSDTVEGSKEKYSSKNVDGKEDKFKKPEDLHQLKRDTTEDRSREMMKGKRKLDDESRDEQPEAKSRSKTTRNELNDNQQKGFQESSRSFRNKDATEQLREDYSREKKSGGGHIDKQVGRIYGDEEPQKEIIRKNDLEHKKEERDHREIRRSDLDRKEERDHREIRRSDLDRKEERDHRERRRSDLDRKEERESKRSSRNDDEDIGLVRHRKDEEDSLRKNGRDDLEGQHGRSRRRGREEGEEHRDEKNRHVDSSKRAKYDDYRPEDKKKYDDDKRGNRDDVRARRRD